MGEDASLARAGSSEDQQRAALGLGGAALFWIEGV